MTHRDIKNHLLNRDTVGDVIRRYSKRNPDKLAFVLSPPQGSPIEYTYSKFNESANRLANGLTACGIKKGEGVAIFSLNTYQLLLTIAVAKIGAYIIPVNPALTRNEMEYVIKQSDAKIIFVEDTFADKILSALPNLLNVKPGFIKFSGKNEKPDGWIDFEELISIYPENEPEVEIDSRDMLTLTYTSGTEAFPKGVALMHQNWLSISIACQIDSYMGVHEDEVMLESLPLFYTGGMGVGLFPILMGATTVSTYSPDLARMVEMMAKYKTTYTVLTPTIYLRLFHTEGIKEAATSMRKFLTFGATIPERMITKGREIAPHIQWVSLYALSEPTCCGAVGLFKTINEIPEGDLGWVGKPAPSLEMRIVDDNNNDVPVGDVGELVFRGPVVMKEYYKQPELTAKVFDSGWFHTGDLGRLNKNGELFFVDRKKDMIKSGGENISTASVEYAISSYPKVSEVAVFGVPHPEWMEASVAAVIPIQNEYLAEEEIIQYCKQNLPRFKVPKYVLIVNDFPRNPTGKILKRELREQYKDIASQGQ